MLTIFKQALIRTLKYATFYEKEFYEAYERYGDANPGFFNIFQTHREIIDVLYSLDVIGWIEGGNGRSKMHWHYREVKAIDELYRLPWEQFDCACEARLMIHKGASKHILGVAKK